VAHPLFLWFPLIAIAAHLIEEFGWPGARSLGYWLVVAAIAGANGLFHVRASFRTRTYSPGVVTGVALYIPLAIAGCWNLLETGQVSFAIALQAIAIAAAYAWWSTSQHRRHVQELTPVPPPRAK
jgi:hypothetical protein